MPMYDFKCQVCGVSVTSSHGMKSVPDRCDLYCPRCEKDTDHFRILSTPAVGRGGSGEPFRDSV
jgi:putative FmdB family regulatory protein